MKLERISWLPVLAALCLSTSAQASEGVSAVAWQKGPVEAKLGNQAVLKVPEGYGFLGATDAQALLKEMGNFPSGQELGLVAAQDGNWFVVIRFIDAGYVKDDEAENWKADEMLAAIKAGTEDANEQRKQLGFDPLVVKGWEETPRYDKATNKVVWALSAESKEHLTVNDNTLALGREGYMSMNMVGSLEDLPTLKPHAETLLASLHFEDGKKYGDFNSATDKVAAVGLTALIAGAAFKSGLLAKFWAFLIPLLIAGKKLIVLIVIAVGGIAAKFWNSRQPATPHQ